MPPEIFTSLLENAPSLGISLFALWIVSKKLWRSQEDHLAAHKERVQALETHTEECDKDREQLHKMHADLQADVIDKLTALIDTK